MNSCDAVFQNRTCFLSGLGHNRQLHEAITQMANNVLFKKYTKLNFLLKRKKCLTYQGLSEFLIKYYMLF